MRVPTNKLRLISQMLVLSMLMGLTVGVGLMLTELHPYANVPIWVGYVLIVVAGLMTGLLVSDLSRALGTYLLILIVGGAVSILALAYPELQMDRLGTQVALDLSIINTMKKLVLLALPLTLLGLILGKFVSR